MPKLVRFKKQYFVSESQLAKIFYYRQSEASVVNGVSP
jgi:hypothetical protein